MSNGFGIKKAEKLMKRQGGTLSENLEKVTGRKSTNSMSLDLGAMNRQLQSNHDYLDRQIKELNENIARDFGIQPGAMSMSATETSSVSTSTGETAALLSGDDALEAFNGLADEDFAVK